MDIIREFVEEHFTPRVSEDKNGLKVIFESRSNTVRDGVIWFEKAKKGWNKKPLTTNTYIIVDAELREILKFLNRYFNLNEDHYHDVRKMFIQKGMDVMDGYLNSQSES
jgi:hypothetical protein